jgi:hypothetical protein
MIVSECCNALPYPEVYENMGKCSKCKEDSMFYEEDEFDEEIEQIVDCKLLEEELEKAHKQVKIAKDAFKFLSGHPTSSLNYKYISKQALDEMFPEAEVSVRERGISEQIQEDICTYLDEYEIPQLCMDDLCQIVVDNFRK